MNPEPRLYGIPTTPQGCGRIAIENVVRAFWQSRDPEHRLPDLADLKKLAREIRASR